MGANAERMAGYGRKNRRRGRGEGYPIELYIEGDTGITQQWERQQDKEAVAEFNRKVRAWGRNVNTALQTSIGQMITEDKTLSGSLRQNYRHWGKVPQAGQEITSIVELRQVHTYVHDTLLLRSPSLCDRVEKQVVLIRLLRFLEGRPPI